MARRATRRGWPPRTHPSRQRALVSNSRPRSILPSVIWPDRMSCAVITSRLASSWLPGSTDGAARTTTRRRTEVPGRPDGGIRALDAPGWDFGARLLPASRGRAKEPYPGRDVPTNLFLEIFGSLSSARPLFQSGPPTASIAGLTASHPKCSIGHLVEWPVAGVEVDVARPRRLGLRRDPVPVRRRQRAQHLEWSPNSITWSLAGVAEEAYRSDSERSEEPSAARIATARARCELVLEYWAYSPIVQGPSKSKQRVPARQRGSSVGPRDSCIWSCRRPASWALLPDK